MFAIIAAILFGLALIIQLASISTNNIFNTGTLTTAGLLCLALHLAGALKGRRWMRR
jgi:hypothetical protein